MWQPRNHSWRDSSCWHCANVLQMQAQNHCCLLVLSVRSLIRPVPGAPKSFFQYTSKPVPALFTYYKTAASIWGWAWYRSVTNESVAQTDSVSRGTVPNGWRQGQCGTAVQSAAAHFDRRPLDKALPDAFERYSAGMREKETWAILHGGRADRLMYDGNLLSTHSAELQSVLQESPWNVSF